MMKANDDASGLTVIDEISESEFTKADWDRLRNRLFATQAEIPVGFENEPFPYIWHDNLNWHDHSKSCTCCLGAPGDNDRFRPIVCKCGGLVHRFIGGPDLSYQHMCDKCGTIRNYSWEGYWI